MEIQKVHEGDNEAFREIFELYYRPITFFCIKHLQNDYLAEDVAQECFIKLWKNRKKIESQKHIYHWLYQTAKRACMDFYNNRNYRAKSLKGFVSLLDEEYCDPKIKEHQYMERLSIFFKSKKKLPKRYETAIDLKLQSVPIRDCKKKMNTTSNVIYLLQCRAISKLINQLKIS